MSMNEAGLAHEYSLFHLALMRAVCLNLQDIFKYQSQSGWCIELTFLGGGMAMRTEIVRGPPN